MRDEPSDSSVISLRTDARRRAMTTPPAESASGMSLCLLGTFRFSTANDAFVSLPGASQRLLAFLALRNRTMTRTATAGALWPNVTDAHAYASLRSAISRLAKITRDAIRVTVHELCLGDEVSVDMHASQGLAHRLLDRAAVKGPADLSEAAVSALSVDLLPDWYDDWVVIEAEAWHQLRLHALEALTELLVAQRRFGDATSSALAAVQADPLRESSHAALIRVHLAEGNQSEALSVFRRYQLVLRAELGLEPTRGLRDLIAATHATVTPG
jgi:DNA-binding SARP family transcriptional activator